MDLIEAHDRIRATAIRRAGTPDDLVLRATTYIDLYRHSGGNHGFPLLAAHGALWGARHFRRGRIVGRALAYLTGLEPAERARQLARIDAFALALKEINRRVCVETYTAYHLSDRFGDKPELANLIPETLINALLRCHVARKAGQKLSARERRTLFAAFFMWEQSTIVGPAVQAAVAKLDWPLLRAVSVRPPIGFAYFPRTTWLWFRAFDDAEERILRGKQAFDLAERCGWDHVEACLSRYRLLPTEVAPAKCRLCPV